RGAPGWADGKIFVADVNAKFHILKPDERRCRELSEVFFPSKGGQGFVETAGTPAVADGRVYFGSRDEMYCIGKKDWKAAAQEPRGDRILHGTFVFSGRDANDPVMQPAHVQVVPADVTLHPGE